MCYEFVEKMQHDDEVTANKSDRSCKKLPVFDCGMSVVLIKNDDDDDDDKVTSKSSVLTQMTYVYNKQKRAPREIFCLIFRRA